MAITCTENTKCLACDSDKLVPSISFGSQPLANSYLSSPNDPEETFPLGVMVCSDCFHMQLTHTVSPEAIYQNYLYVSGTTQTNRDYFTWFAKFVSEYSTKKSGSILDIGCNDGSQLDAFLELGYNTWGVDPAQNLHANSSAKHKVTCDFFNAETPLYRQFDTIIAQNVFAHNPNPQEFLSTCARLMKDDSLLFIQTSQADMIANDEFDTIYHEHINFFNTSSMKKVAESARLHLIDVVRTPIHGVSNIFILSKNVRRPANIENIVKLEAKLHSLDTYKAWEQSIAANAKSLKDAIQKYKAAGKTIVGYGAAAKGNTILNYIQEPLDFIIDDNPLKQGKFTPGTKTPITSIDKLQAFSEDETLIFIPLSWNFYDEIKDRINKVRNTKNDVFIRYFPKYDEE